MIFFSFRIKNLCTVKKQKSRKKRDLFFFEKTQYCLTSVFDIPINLVLAVSLLTIYPLGSKHQYNSFYTFGASRPTESLKPSPFGFGLRKFALDLVVIFFKNVGKFFCKKLEYGIKPNFSKDKIRLPLAIFSAFLKKLQ